MSDVLLRIKRAVLAGYYRFSEKALIELERDGLSKLDVVESITTSVAIYKKIRSTSPSRAHKREYLYVIISPNLEGIPIYTKGKLIRSGVIEEFYFLVSSKRSTE